MDHPTDLDLAAGHDVEHQVFIYHEDSIPETPEARVPGLPARSWEECEAADRLVYPVHEGPGGVRVVPGDVIEDVKKVLLGGGEIPKVVPSGHGTRARSRRIISVCPIPFTPAAAWASASSSFRYNSNWAWRRS